MSTTRILVPLRGRPTSLRSATYKAATHTSPRCSSSKPLLLDVRLRNYSSKRQLQTATVYRPRTLDPHLPPPTNAVPATSLDLGDSSRLHGVKSNGFNATVESSSDASVRYGSTSAGGQEFNGSKILQAEVETQPTAISKTSTKPSRISKLRPRKAAMSLTPAAVAHLRELLSSPDPKLIRVGVKNRGCSGLAYHLEYVDKASAFDEAVEQDGVKILIDSKALFSIIGSEMDWVTDKLAQRFVFRNPNISKYMDTL